MFAVKMPQKDVIEVREVEIPRPGKGEVLIQMKASALCRSDLHVLHRTELFEADEMEFTSGHEPCGVVAELGENVESVKIGDRVAIFLAVGCGKCEHCQSGNVVLCKELGMLGRHMDGAHADYVVVPEECCLPMPEGMDFVTGALATDVGGTLYTACKRLGVSGATTVAIFGVGPMGMGGVLMAKGFGATVIAVDNNAERLALATRLGADYAVNFSEVNCPEEIMKITGGVGTDAAIVCSGASKAINDALDTVRPYGAVGQIGETSACTINPSEQLMRKFVDYKGCWYFNRSDWKEISSFIVRKDIRLREISTRAFDISEAVEAFKLFDSGKTQKVLFVWD